MCMQIYQVVYRADKAIPAVRQGRKALDPNILGGRAANATSIGEGVPFMFDKELPEIFSYSLLSTDP